MKKILIVNLWVKRLLIFLGCLFCCSNVYAGYTSDVPIKICAYKSNLRKPVTVHYDFAGSKCIKGSVVGGVVQHIEGDLNLDASTSIQCSDRIILKDIDTHGGEVQNTCIASLTYNVVGTYSSASTQLGFTLKGGKDDIADVILDGCSDNTWDKPNCAKDRAKPIYLCKTASGSCSDYQINPIPRDGAEIPNYIYKF